MATSGAPELSDKPTVVSTWLCPFAQRTLLALNAKGVQYTHHELSEKDLYDKPAWFLDLNPAGLVPTLAWVEDGKRRVLTESIILNEFVEEALPGPRKLLPADGYSRAKARLVIDRFGSKAVPQFYKMLLQQDKEEQAAAARAFDEQLEWLAREGLDPEGPWALAGWDGPSLVDCAVLPFILRLPILQHYRGYAPPAAAAARLAAYTAAATSHPAVRATRAHPEGRDYGEALIEAYAKYADGSAKSQLARDLQKEQKKGAAAAGGAKAQ